MSKETKEQRIERMAAEKIAEEKAIAAYRLTIPAQMIELQALASDVGVSTYVSYHNKEPILKLFDKESVNFYEEIITYSSEEWQINHVKDKLKTIKKEQEEAAERFKRAQEIFGGLSIEDKRALKENIFNLR